LFYSLLNMTLPAAYLGLNPEFYPGPAALDHAWDDVD